MTANSPVLHVCPIKQLYLMNQQSKIPNGAIAVLCTMNELTAAKLLGITYLHIPFSDITDEASPLAFSIVASYRIREFIDSHPETHDIYFCCDSGESRSTALAAATMHYLGQNEMLIWKNTQYHPNPLVYYLQSKAYGLEITQEDALELASYNKQLFEQQIRRSRSSADTEYYSGGNL